MEEARDQIAVLLQQEQGAYACADYLAHERAVQTTTVPDLKNLLQECANVVTDRSFSPPVVTAHEKVADILRSPSAVCVRELGHNQDVAATITTTGQTSFTFWRQQMFDWAIMVVDSFGMDREVVAMSFSLLDRFIASETKSSVSITREDFQLYSMTCLYISIKILIPYPRKLGIEALVDMSRGFYSPEDISVTEYDILTKLQWRVHPPTAIGFCKLCWSLFPQEPSIDMQMTCSTMTEITIADSQFVSMAPSAVGLAAIYHAARMDGVKESVLAQFCSNLQGLVSTENNPEFSFCYQQLEKLYCR